MKSLPFCILAVMLFSSAVRADSDLKLQASTDTWMSSDSKRLVIRTAMPPATNEQEVRARIAGVMDSMFGAAMLLRPEKWESGVFAELPAVIVTGRSYANFDQRECRVVVAFSTTRTYIVHFFSPGGTPLPELPADVSFDGESLSATEEAFAYLNPRMKDSLPELQKIIDQSVEARGGKK